MEEGRGTCRAGQLSPGCADRSASSLPAHLELREVLHRTPIAVLWRARDRQSGVDVVVKVLHGPLAAAKVEAEARALSRLGHHPHVLAVRAVGIDGAARAWVVTSLANRGSLLDVAPADPTVLRGWVAQVADALAHAHDAGVVHGDVTPANVLLDDSPPSKRPTVPRALLADFGSALVDGGGSHDGTLVGCTPAFAPPERWRGEPPSPAGDVFGLARTAVEVLPGRRLGCLPRGVRRLLTDALDPDPRRRPSAAVLRRGLR